MCKDKIKQEHFNQRPYLLPVFILNQSKLQMLHHVQ